LKELYLLSFKSYVLVINIRKNEPMKPLFFSNQMKFRAWLKEDHNKETALLVGFYKVTSGKASITGHNLSTKLYTMVG